MSICTFIASDKPLQEIMPSKEYLYSININIDKNTIYDGDTDDNFFLQTFHDIESYTNKKYGVQLFWNYYTDGRAKKLLEYIRNALKNEATIEIWHVWLMDYYKYNERPIIRKRMISFADMTIDDIREIDNAEIWNQSDQRNPNRPSFYNLIIKQ